MGNMSKCFTSASLFLFCLILYFLLLYCLTFFTILGNIIQLKYLSIISNICDSCISFRISLTLIVCSHMSKQCVLIHYHFLVLFSIFWLYAIQHTACTASMSLVVVLPCCILQFMDHSEEPWTRTFLLLQLAAGKDLCFLPLFWLQLFHNGLF